MVIRATWSFNGQEKVILGNWHRLCCTNPMTGRFPLSPDGLILRAL
jgi:hypothetical protein